MSIARRRAGHRSAPARCASILTVALALMCAAASAASAVTPGSLDGSFGGGGVSYGAPNTSLLGSAVQSDGRVLAVGESGITGGADLLLERFTTSGALDPSFGSGGVVHGPTVTTAYGPNYSGSIGRAVAVQPDGKIVVVGKATDPSGSGSFGILAERYNANGTLDSSFGAGGVVLVASSSHGDGYGVAIQPNGELLASGAINNATGEPQAAVVRLSSAGGADPSFGAGGVQVINLVYSYALAVALQGDGKVVIAGSEAPGLEVPVAIVARLTGAGALDQSFNGSGVFAKQYAIGASSSSFNAVTVQSDGNIVAAGDATMGNGSADAVFARFTAAGAPDGSFGSRGTVYTPSASNYSASGTTVPGANGVVQATNGDIVGAGYVQNGVQTTIALWAFAANGSPAPGFGFGGNVRTGGVFGLNAQAASVSLAPGGNLVIAGDASSTAATSYTGLTARYIGFEPQPAPPPPPPPALKVTLKYLSVSYKIRTAVAHGVKVGVGCNQPCKIQVTLVASASADRTLGLGKVTRRCRKVHGRRRCTTSHRYFKTTLIRGSSTLRTGQTHTFVLRFARNVDRALGRIKKRHSVKLTFTTSVTSTVSKQHKSISKTLTFRP